MTDLGEIIGEGIKPNTGIYCDLSKWNDTVNFPELKSHIDGAFIRASNGLNKTDPLFAKHTKGCIDNNILWGSYHFASFTQDAKAQAAKFMAIVEASGKPSMQMVLDVETNEKKLPINGFQLEILCETFLSTLEQHGYDTMIYMSPGFSWFLPKNHKLGKYKLWCADYDFPINKINGWNKPYMLQYTDKGSLPGVKWAVDLSRLM